MMNEACDQKPCIVCERVLPQREFSINALRSERSRCKQCTTQASGTTSIAEPKLQALLMKNQVKVVAGALEEVGLVGEDRSRFLGIWNENIEAYGTSKLNVVMNKIVAALMRDLADATKDQKDRYRLVWSTANQRLFRILNPDRKDLKAEKKKCTESCVHPWPVDEVVRGFWVTVGSSRGRQKGAKEEFLTALEPVARGLDAGNV